MNSRDLIMVLSSLLSMAAGVFLPQAAEPLAAMPRLILIFMLYMSFLAVGMEALMREIRHMKGTLCFLVALRLAVLPLLCLAVFRLCMPQFALGAFRFWWGPIRRLFLWPTSPRHCYCPQACPPCFPLRMPGCACLGLSRSTCPRIWNLGT